ncbi:MAG: DUF2842 domain-containing protein [Vannielia sp.]|uniref:DUF2842 domain-containing protein n=1 Tax=Rhodobacterales TaxID=204455 RepID=UPI00209647CD|nr:DUF2842 domain-containing protein [Oceanicola sp. 502str15]MCO6382963.1 DUF2842 domain-containing protein [Oceanicola sp. 502str15]
MALSYKARRRWSLVILLVGLPLYIAFAWWLTSLLPDLPLLVELLVFVILGVAWTIPVRKVFYGVGKDDPDA